ncbi:hypothetical protein AGDE_16882 [Angomonas deanei]|uniref:Uncharacterized protein n=1 Tax=Angomonas deanei TaxID=59799 RepID=A0A7G2C5F1_9TRYP|nr:hypothetical protein AGDE_16882 [Angomonas deanei]CAD2214725.1 hypothetical protein, conserved [Angomonas deanei]|eukprot:EPY15985.1 hypothetical protein AGDE_16882 [Angomonas deanei]
MYTESDYVPLADWYDDLFQNSNPHDISFLFEDDPFLKYALEDGYPYAPLEAAVPNPNDKGEVPLDIYRADINAAVAFFNQSLNLFEEFLSLHVQCWDAIMCFYSPLFENKLPMLNFTDRCFFCSVHTCPRLLQTQREVIIHLNACHGSHFSTIGREDDEVAQLRRRVTELNNLYQQELHSTRLRHIAGIGPIRASTAARAAHPPSLEAEPHKPSKQYNTAALAFTVDSSSPSHVSQSLIESPSAPPSAQPPVKYPMKMPTVHPTAPPKKASPRRSAVTISSETPSTQQTLTTGPVSILGTQQDNSSGPTPPSPNRSKKLLPGTPARASRPSARTASARSHSAASHRSHEDLEEDDAENGILPDSPVATKYVRGEGFQNAPNQPGNT